MELKALSEIELRSAIGPLNRALAGRTTGQLASSVLTVAALRERAVLGLLAGPLSRCLVVGGEVVGACLVERLDTEAHITALGLDALAQQRGGGRALIEGVLAALSAAKVQRVTACVSDFDSATMQLLQAAHFQRLRTVQRFVLAGAPTLELLTPELVVQTEAVTTQAQTPPARLLARSVTLAEALDVLAQSALAAPLPFSQRPDVLRKQAGRLTCMALFGSDAAGTQQSVALAAAITDRERKQLLAIGGEAAQMAALGVLLGARYGITHMDQLPESDPAGSALLAAGFSKAAVQAELVLSLPS